MEYQLSAADAAPGVRSCVIKAQGLRTSRISFSFAWNLDDDDCARALLSSLLSNSCAKYTDITQISRRLARLYGASLSSSVSKTGEQQVVKIFLDFIGDRFALGGESIALDCFTLLTDLIFDPLLGGDGLFTEQDVEREKRLLAEEIENEANEKVVYARTRLEQEMFRDELYSHNRLGTAQQARALTAADVMRAYRSMLEQAVTLVVFTGDMDCEPLLKLLEERYRGINRAPQQLETCFIQDAGEPVYVSETDDVKQGKLVMGFRAHMQNEDDNFYAGKVMTDMFGGNVHSKLFMNVREKMSLCYYCSARLIAKKGFILVQSGIETENEQKARDAILGQLKALADGDFTDEDLKASLDSLEDMINRISDTPAELDNWYSAEVTTGRIRHPQELIEGFKRVTRADVTEAARHITLDTVFMLRSNDREDA